MLDTHGGADPLDELEPVADALEVRKLIEVVRGVHVSQDVKRYVVDLADATRRSPAPAPGRLAPRDACSWSGRPGRTRRWTAATSCCRTTCSDLAGPVLAHRLLPTAEAQVDRRTPESVVADLLARVPVPGSRR